VAGKGLMMPRILFVCLHRPGRSPSQRFRFEQYLDYLENQGFDYDFSFLLNEKDDKLFYTKGKYFAKGGILFKSILKRIGEIRRAKNYDIVFVQRECFMLGTAFFEKQFAKRTKVVFDFDDSIWLQNVSESNKKLSFLKNADKTREIIKISHLVIAGNDYLANYARQFNSNTVIIPTTVDTAVYASDQNEFGDKVCIGWSGSFSTIQHFEYSINFLKRLKQKYREKIIFKVIGDASYYNKDLKIKGLPWKRETEVMDLEEIDIGIMPLPDDEWANGKCGLKGLQYMALCIPTVMSPVGVNSTIIKDGMNGFLASSDEEWFDKLCRLIDSPELRKELGQNGRRTVVEKYSVQANKHLYSKYLQSLLH
jgi:glycosyltransferase involved in cell wall biosynthesis